MKSIRQLFRQPLRLTLYICIMALAGAFLCLGIAVFLSAESTVQKTKAVYTTIALPNNETEQRITEINGAEGVVTQSVLTEEMLQFITTLPEQTEDVLGICQQNYVSGYSADIKTLVSAMEAGNYETFWDNPYGQAVFVVCVETIETAKDRVNTIEITAKVKEICFLHEGYMKPQRLHFSYQYESEEKLQQAALEIGGIYLVYGRNYVDRDLELRTELAEALGLSIEKIDWNNISYDVEEFNKSQIEYGSENFAAAKYLSETGGVFLEQSELEMIHTAEMNVSDSGFLGMKIPSIVRLWESSEAFLESEEGTPFREMLAQAGITNQSLPVIGTDKIEAVYGFHSGAVLLSEGRNITEKEYQEGKKVCLISQALAEANGLKVGERLPLRFYLGSRYLEWDHNPPAMEYMGETFSGIMEDINMDPGFLTEQEMYEIIGIYRQTDAWSNTDSYAFTPNTVFVPNRSIECDTLSKFTGIYYALLLKNGSVEAVQQLAEKNGFPNIFYYFDQGYSYIAESLKEFEKNAFLLVTICMAVWIAVYVWYLIMYVGKQKETAALMRVLGAGKWDTIRHIFLSCFFPIFCAVMPGGAVAAAFFDKVFVMIYQTGTEMQQNKLFSSTLISGTEKPAQLLLQEIPQAVWIVVGFQLLLFAVGIGIAGYRMTSLHRNPVVETV